jgi:hypothetical protein
VHSGSDGGVSEYRLANFAASYTIRPPAVLEFLRITRRLPP